MVAQRTHAPDTFSRGFPDLSGVSDADLLARILWDFPESFWSRFRALSVRCHEETMTRAERQEFITYTDRTEQWAADRLWLLIELARRRGVAVRALMAELDIRPKSLD